MNSETDKQRMLDSFLNHQRRCTTCYAFRNKEAELERDYKKEIVHGNDDKGRETRELPSHGS